MTCRPTGTCWRSGQCDREECHQRWLARERRRRKLTALGRPLMVEATGTRRRLQALACRGWSTTAVAARLGITQQAVSSLRSGRTPTTARRIAQGVADLYAAQSDSWVEGHCADLARAHARRQGWAPPAAWDDPDRDEGPQGVPCAVPGCINARTEGRRLCRTHRAVA